MAEGFEAVRTLCSLCKDGSRMEGCGFAEDSFEQALVLKVTMVVPQVRGGCRRGRGPHLSRSVWQGCHRLQLIITSLVLELGPHWLPGYCVPAPGTVQ